MSNAPLDNAGGQAPPKKKNTLLIVLGVLGALMLVVAIGCCGLSYWGYSKGSAMIAEAVKAELVASPAAKEHLGDIQDLSLNLSASGEQQQAQGDSELFVMDVTGSKGSGQLVIKKSPSGEMSDIQILLPDGTTIPAFGDELMDFDAGDIDLGE